MNRMKKSILLLIAAAALFGCTKNDGCGKTAKPVEISGQAILSTSPSFVMDNTDDVVVTIDTKGSALQDYSGEVYAHTGVLTDKSAASSDWKYVLYDWTVNNEKCHLKRQSANTYTLTISGGPRAFYGVSSADKIVSLAFVFRSADCSKELKDNGNDFFVNLSEPGLDVKILSPADRSALQYNAIYTVTVASKDASKVELFRGSAATPVASTTSAADLKYKFTTSAYEDICFVAVASKDGNVVRDTLSVAVLGKTVNAARPSGATDGVAVDGTKATFVLYAPGKESVVLLGEFNRFAVSNKHMLKRDGDYFWTTVDGLAAGRRYAYQYLVDGSVKVADPYSHQILDPWNDGYISSAVYPDLKPYPAGQTTDIVSVFSTSATSFDWKAASYNRPDRKTLAIYELLVRDFTEQGTIKAATAKLDYLEALGVNAIELMPVQEFDGNDSWGYNPCFYFAPDKAYGTPDDYKTFIDECHSRGMAVILDVVFNHATGQFPWAKMWTDSDGSVSAANPFFNKVAKHPYNVFNDFNHEYAKTRSYFKDVLRYWLSEYRVDGFRFDLSKGFTQTDSGSNVDKWGQYDASRIAIIKDYVDALRAADPDCYIILEHFAQSSEENVLAQYKNTLLWRNAVTGYSETVMGWKGNSNFDYVSASGRVGYIESHDEERVAYKAKTYGQTFVRSSLQRICSHLQGAYALHFLSPEAKMMWQFGELGYDYSIDYNGRTGRKPIKWDYMNVAERKAVYDALCKIISFRTSHPQMYSSDTVPTVWAVGDANMSAKTLVYSTAYGSVMAVANFTDAPSVTSLAVPSKGVWTNLIDGSTVDMTADTYSVTLPAGDYTVFVKN